MCQNSGILLYKSADLSKTCICECLPGYTGDNCEPTEGGCVDDDACGTQFPEASCNLFPILQTICKNT